MSKVSERLDNLERKVETILSTRQAAQAVSAWPIGKIVTVTGVYREYSFGGVHRDTERITVTGRLRSARQGAGGLTVDVGGLVLIDAEFYT